MLRVSRKLLDLGAPVVDRQPLSLPARTTLGLLLLLLLLDIELREEMALD